MTKNYKKFKSGIHKERKNFLYKIFSFFKTLEELHLFLKSFEEIFNPENFFKRSMPDLNFLKFLSLEIF